MIGVLVSILSIVWLSWAIAFYAYLTVRTFVEVKGWK